MALTKITGDGYGAGTITTADNTTQLTLTSTDADANAGPVLDLHRNSSSPADNDVLGLLNFKGENDASEIISYASINGYIGDASDGSEDGRVIHRVYKDGTNINLVDMKSDEVVFNEDSKDINFRVESDGNAHMLFVSGGDNQVAIGTGSNTTDFFAVESTQTDANAVTDIRTTATSSYTGSVLKVGGHRQTFNGTYNQILCVVHGHSNRFLVQDGGNVQNADNSYGALSDRRMKENIADASSQWDDIKGLRVRKYNMIGDTDTHLGVISQELEDAGMSGLVQEGEWYHAEANPNNETRKSVKYSILYMKAVKALQEAMTRIETLETEMTALKARVTALEDA